MVLRLELGAGGGLVGLAVALGCNPDQPLYMTDQKPMLALMRHNIALNNLQETVRAEVLDWGDPVPPTVPSTSDVILAADCVYFEPAFPLLQTTLLQLIGPETVCYFCFKKRRRADLQFMKKVRKVLEVREVGDDSDRETYARENIFLYVYLAVACMCARHGELIIVLQVCDYQEEMSCLSLGLIRLW